YYRLGGHFTISTNYRTFSSSFVLKNYWIDQLKAKDVRVCLDPKKLLREGKITLSEFERIKSLSSIRNSPYISYIFVSLIFILGTMNIFGPLLLFSPIIILIGIVVLVFEKMRIVRKNRL
ncbi:MAG: hypothetical protein AAB300_01990, partial [Nitrospirota bacterium]